MSVDEAVLWRSVAETLERVVAPALTAGAELDTVVQLEGLARYAATRPAPDPGGRAERLSRALRPHAVTHDLPAALDEASRTLVAALDPHSTSLVRQRAAAVRFVLLDLLAEDVATVAPLMESFAGHPAQDIQPRERTLPRAELEALTAWFGLRFGAPVRIVEASVISGGHSRRMLRVSVSDASDKRHDFVVRIEQGGTFGTDGTLEAGLMRALETAGVAVAPVRWIETSPAALGQPFFVMDLVAGGSAVDDAALDSYVETLDALHHLDPQVAAAALGPPPATPEIAIAAQISHWTKIHHESVDTPVPLLEEAAEWLRRHLQPTGPVAVVHGDPGPGNFLLQDGRIVALTDWELGHYGDPAEDWAYLAIRGRKVKNPLAWHERFSELAGIKYDDETWRHWEAFNSFKGACANLTALRIFREETATTPNLLAIGTAVHFRFLQRLADLVGGAD
jgi:aminoglycoside phosphotransferase (APT) family kinase protein